MCPRRARPPPGAAPLFWRHIILICRPCHRSSVGRNIRFSICPDLRCQTGHKLTPRHCGDGQGRSCPDHALRILHRYQPVPPCCRRTSWRTICSGCPATIHARARHHPASSSPCHSLLHHQDPSDLVTGGCHLACTHHQRTASAGRPCRKLVTNLRHQGPPLPPAPPRYI
jgi:hypothetical protein